MNQFQSGEWADVPGVGQPAAPPQPRQLSVVLPFIPKEIEQVKNLLRRSTELCGQIPRSLFLIPFKGTNASDIEALAKEAFAQVGTIKDSEGIMSDWQNGQMIRSASGPNSLFRQAAWFFYLSNGRFGAWLWLEPDCTVIGKRWLFDLEQEYYETQKPFMGVQMIIQDGRRYMNGVGVYPWNAIQYAPLLVQSSMWKQHPTVEVGFDVAGGFDVLKQAHMTRKIQLELKTKNVELKPETVLLHGQNLSGGAKASLPNHNENQGAALSGNTLSTQQNLSGNPASNPAAQKETEPAVSPAQPDAARNEEDQSKAGAHPSPCTDEPPASSPLIKEHVRDYGAISEMVRNHVQDLVRLWDSQPHRKVLIVKELRKAKLVPKHFR